MLEIIDVLDNTKMMAMIMFGIEYDDQKYVVYGVRRGNEEVNIFVSKLFKNSEGLILDNNFENGEKEAIEGIIRRLFNKVVLLELEKDGIKIFKDIFLNGVIYFDSKKCYVTTISRSFIKDFLVYYDLVTKQMLERPVVEVVESKSKFNEGFVGNLALIVFGILIIGVALVAIVQFFVK